MTQVYSYPDMIVHVELADLTLKCATGLLRKVSSQLSETFGLEWYESIKDTYEMIYEEKAKSAIRQNNMKYLQNFVDALDKSEQEMLSNAPAHFKDMHHLETYVYHLSLVLTLHKALCSRTVFSAGK